jgi:signal transduction histidine kinase
MKESFQKIRDFLGPYDYRPGFIYTSILLLNLSNLRSYTFEYEYRLARIKFFFIGFLVYLIIGLPVYFVLKIFGAVRKGRQKTFRYYLFEIICAVLCSLLSQIVGQRYILPSFDIVNFLPHGLLIFEIVVRFIFAIIFVSITHNQLKILSQKLDFISALNNELNERYATLINSDEEIKSHASQLLHDRIQSKLMLAGAKLTRLSEVFTDEGRLGVLPVIKELEHIRSIDIREVSQLLTPNIEGEGLIGSCENLKKEFLGEVDFILEIPQEIENTNDELKLGIYRIIEQSVINSIKHGPASKITIRVQASNQNELTVEVIDNGPGAEKIGSGKGSVIIDAWLSILSGRKVVETKPGKGFSLRVYLPINSL